MINSNKGGKNMIYTITLNPAIDKTLQVPEFTVNQVNRIKEKRTDIGGKGLNVSKTLLSLGSNSIALGIVGGRNGKTIIETLHAMGIKEDFVQVAEETRVNTKIVDDKNNTFTDINEKGSSASNEILNQIEEKILRKTTKSDIVVIAGKLPPDTDVKIYNKWIEILKKQGTKVFLDSDGEEFVWGVKGKPSLIKPNEDELERLIGKSLYTMEDIIRAGKELVAKGIEKVIVSLGAKGALFINKDQVLLGHGLKVKVKSTVGAGDAMMAALAYAQEKNLSFKEGAALAIATSSATIIEEGTKSAKKETIEKLLNQVVVEKIEKGDE